MANWKKISANFIKIALLCVLLACGAALLAEKIDLTTADLGRHIENGKIILSQGLGSAVLRSNFYSYTQPDFPTVNHHWGGGVIFYFLTLLGGFNLDSVFYIALGVLTLLGVFDLARKICDFWTALGLGCLLLPLMMSRTEVRPEIITYFFSAVFLWILWHWKSGRISARWLYALPGIVLVWVNIHIGWFFGPLLGTLFLIGEIWTWFVNRGLAESASAKRRAWLLFWVLGLCGIASLINPNFLRGALEPLTIFKSYGYLIVENQTVPFLERLGHSAGLHFTLLKWAFAVLAASFLAALAKLRGKIQAELVLLGATSAIMAWMGLRNFPFFGFFGLPVLAYFASAWKPAAKSRLRIFKAIAVPTALFLLLISVFQTRQEIQARGAAEGIGLLPGVEDSADFFRQNNIAGPVFNDYDIGGYLIYNFNNPHPLHKSSDSGAGQADPLPKGEGEMARVFVDNRPEAYSVDFFQNVYIPAQEYQGQWQKLDARYNFNAIFFSYRDLTPWAQEFLLARINDPNWAPVFVDGYNIIFLKNNPQNQSLIKQYRLPPGDFTTQ